MSRSGAISNMRHQGSPSSSVFPEKSGASGSAAILQYGLPCGLIGLDYATWDIGIRETEGVKPRPREHASKNRVEHRTCGSVNN
jgi:hypothetical protein